MPQPFQSDNQDFRKTAWPFSPQWVTLSVRYDRNQTQNGGRTDPRNPPPRLCPPRLCPPRLCPGCLIAPPRSSVFSSSVCPFRRSAGSGLSSRSGQGAAAARWYPVVDLTMSANAVSSPRRAYRDDPGHVPAGTPSPPGPAELVISLLCHHAASAGTGSARNASPLFHMAWRTTESLRATATTAFLWPFLAFSIRPHRFRALSDRERVSTVLAAS